jgi:hypothetical protein
MMIIVDHVAMCVLHHIDVKTVCVLKQQHVLVVVLGNGWGQQATGINDKIVFNHAFVILLLMMELCFMSFLNLLVILM